METKNKKDIFECDSCGNEVSENDLYCSCCGQKFEEENTKINEYKCLKCGNDITNKKFCSKCGMENNNICECPKCGILSPKNFKTCEKCGEKLTEKKNDSETGYNFKTLLYYGSLNSFIGGVIIFIGIIFLILSIVNFSMDKTINNIYATAFILFAIFSIISGFLLVVFGQSISCFVTIEKNTRKTYCILEKYTNSNIK